MTHCPFRSWCEICVGAKSPDVHRRKQPKPSEEKLPVIEFDYTFGTDRHGDPERKVAILVATDSVRNSVVSLMARRKGASDEYVVQGMLNYIDRLGLVKAEQKCDQEPGTIELAKVLAKRCTTTTLIQIATPKGSKG